jgi:hypothetical protein
MMQKKGFFILMAMVFCASAIGHVLPKIETTIVPLSNVELISAYIQMGFLHVIPLGFDHVLFILGIFLLHTHWKPIIIQCSVFTLAHSVTLAFCASGLIVPNSRWVEVFIAFSIFCIALENIFYHKVQYWRLPIIFGFGLIHGMGFANAIQEMGLPQNYFWSSLITFNVGVELAQLSIVLIAWFCIAKWINAKTWYRQRVIIPSSVSIGLIALYWMVERIFV